MKAKAQNIIFNFIYGAKVDYTESIHIKKLTYIQERTLESYVSWWLSGLRNIQYHVSAMFWFQMYHFYHTGSSIFIFPVIFLLKLFNEGKCQKKEQNVRKEQYKTLKIQKWSFKRRPWDTLVSFKSFLCVCVTVSWVADTQKLTVLVSEHQ